MAITISYRYTSSRSSGHLQASSSWWCFWIPFLLLQLQAIEVVVFLAFSYRRPFRIQFSLVVLHLAFGVHVPATAVVVGGSWWQCFCLYTVDTAHRCNVTSSHQCHKQGRKIILRIFLSKTSNMFLSAAFLMLQKLLLNSSCVREMTSMSCVYPRSCIDFVRILLLLVRSSAFRIIISRQMLNRSHGHRIEHLLV